MPPGVVEHKPNGKDNMEQMKTRRILGVAITMMVLLAVSTVPAMACPCESQEPIDEMGQQKVMRDPVATKALIEQLSDAGDNADALYASLPPEAQAAVLEYLKVAQVTTNVSTAGDGTSVLAGGSRGCRSYQVRVDGKNIYGIRMFSYFQKIDWCYDGSKITNNPTRLRWGEVYAPFWLFDGYMGNSESGGINQGSYRAWTQGAFKYCLGGDIGRIQHKYPWIDMTVYGYGSYSSSTGM